MVLNWRAVLAAIATASTLIEGASTIRVGNHEPGTFSYNRTTFLLNNEAYQIIGGQMDPQRIPHEYWAQRLQMAKSMGLNTIFSYLFWNDLEPTPGDWDFTDRNNVGHFFQLAHDAGLKIVLRPGPYVCAEHEWGGLPGWLNKIPGMAIRQNNEPFLAASKQYIDQLGDVLGKYQITRGGPIIMTQLENEYGSFGSDKDYLNRTANLLRDNFDVILYTNDGGGKSYLDGGSLHDVLAETDGDAQRGFAARDKYVTDPTMLGPQLDGEYYTTWLDVWGSNYTHRQMDAAALKKASSDLDWVLSGKNSFSLYMFHGGTNWAFDAGAIWDKEAAAVATTSYDYGAPLDESGRPSAAYEAFRTTIAKHVPAGSIPKVPAFPPLTTVPKFSFKSASGLFDFKGDSPTASTVYPVTMDSLDQIRGFILYEHTVTEDVEGVLAVGDQPRDRVLVYVNEVRVGVIDRIYKYPATVKVTLKEGDKLSLLIENMARIDAGQRMVEQIKGIVGNVTVGGGESLIGWETYSMPLTELPEGAAEGTDDYEVKDNQQPAFFRGSFELPQGVQNDMSGDTFLSLPNNYKGVVWVNNRLIGRYWAIGPQQSLYIPGVYLNAPGTANEVVLLELEPSTGTEIVGEGIAERKWFNSPDKNLSGK
ncbi:hypothetical protein VHEMI04642 [[Torrubiella] hemipterigena]|uniref:Beta-galactosidase n=1 Tax=[Torrubiella] hemipterigena TaxID=1531966 RepID=A0A0A1TEH3_9HYPO|nr:hypothetical protein VHEMI04642 [[Torrubiella] hemipterigena]